MATVKGRSYRSPLREQQAQQTRDRLAAGALALFTEKGYQATTVAEIARSAGVSVPTVHAVFEGKKGLARHLLRQAIQGTDVPQEERPDPDRILHARGGHAKLTEFCATSGRIGRRGAHIYQILLAASGDQDISALLNQIAKGRLDQMTIYANDLADSNLLRSGMSAERARDILYWAGSPQLYLQMVTELGWPVGEFVDWLTESLTAMLIKPRRAAAWHLLPDARAETKPPESGLCT